MPFLICDLPASLEDIESQCQVMSICEDLFFERPVLQRFSTAVRDIFQHERDTGLLSDMGPVEPRKEPSMKM